MTEILASDWSEHWRRHTMFISRQPIRGQAESARQKTVCAYPIRRRFPFKRQHLTALFCRNILYWLYTYTYKSKITRKYMFKGLFYLGPFGNLIQHFIWEWVLMEQCHYYHFIINIYFVVQLHLLCYQSCQWKILHLFLILVYAPIVSNKSSCCIRFVFLARVTSLYRP